MGRKDFFAKRDELAKERRRLQREKNGYAPGTHKEEDSIREKDKRLPKTNELHRETMNLWLEFTADPENGYEYYKTFLGSPAPTHEMIKAYIRWYANSIQGRLNDDGLPTVRTVSAHAEKFFGGFEQFTRTKIVPDDRKEIKMWIKKTLTADGVVVDQKKEKLNFTKQDFLRTVSSLWQTDHQTFIPGLLKVVILFALQLYLFTGARVGAFIPSSEDKHERGLRYEHIKLILFPSSTGRWAVGWKVDQKWLKNRRCEKYTVFGIGIRDSNRPQFASGYLLLSLALAHGAIYGVDTVDDLAQFDLSNGEIRLRWKEEYLDKPVLRHATADGPQETPLTKQKFCSCLRQIFTAAGYFGELATIHCIRRNLGKKVEKRNGSAPVSQILAHRGLNTFPEHYQAHCSSIDTVGAVLDEEDQSDHIEYFQGYVQYYERGLPGELPAEIKESILEKPDMVEMRAQIDSFAQNHDENSLKNKKLEYRKALVRHRLFELRQYQIRWAQEKRDRKVINRGKEEPTHSENDIRARAQMLIMPEVARIATAMSSTKELSFDEKLLFVEDLQTQCLRDFDVVYLPNESPVQGLCPVKGCQINIASLRKCDRSAHIHGCIRREKAFGLQISESEMRFCYECMDWCLSSQWRDHCDTHLQSWKAQHCEVIIYRHTVIRPGYCPFCLWDPDLSAEKRLRYWLRSDNLREHIEGQHLAKIGHCQTKPICGCSQSFHNERDLRLHLHDAHGLKETIWQNPKLPSKRKRTCKLEAQISSTGPQEGHSKKARFYHYSHPSHEREDCVPEGSSFPVPALLPSVEGNLEQYSGQSICDKYSVSNRSNSVEPCFSELVSSPSSGPTTPGLEAIDPRILEPPKFNSDNARQSCDQAAIQPESLNFPHEECEATSVSGIKQPQPPALSFASQPSGYCAVTEANEERKNLQEHLTSLPTRDQAVTAEFGCDSNLPTREDGKQNLPCDDQVPPSSPRRPLTRAKAQTQSPQHYPGGLDGYNPPKRLNAKNKRKLRDLQRKNLTLRQIGPHFADVDMALLRQAWMELKPSQRCTRSRANWNGN
ncbi:uncharacterized protein N7525_007441 [Penicillium rubens]|uniref:uncharacterized protein n=1 Tax=Penicillium rubens TaxID=1108849 RepID=UPI002A59B4BC|nr:uncharacterized protein N7525_007441 [Penicillium rubens]KAJ5829188.1 hypothetical protein N7525_007441 [Penicillium rubens]